MGRDSFEAATALTETVVDSLDIMRFWLLLEEQLGTQLSMHALESEPAPAQLMALLERQLRLEPDSSDTPLVFFMLAAGGTCRVWHGFGLI